jgi:hypothetical protein
MQWTGKSEMTKEQRIMKKNLDRRHGKQRTMRKEDTGGQWTVRAEGRKNRPEEKRMDRRRWGEEQKR